MGTEPTAVLDANVLLSLATPVVDGRDRAPSGADPLRTVLATDNVHVPATVVGEVTTAAQQEDLLGTAATLVLRSTAHVTTHDIGSRPDDGVTVGLDRGEAAAIRLANDREADLLVTDEFNSTTYLLIATAVADRTALVTPPHLLCRLAETGRLPPAYVQTALSYYVETNGWDRTYVAALRGRYLG
jgi:hypothetical protein